MIQGYHCLLTTLLYCYPPYYQQYFLVYHIALPMLIYDRRRCKEVMFQSFTVEEEKISLLKTLAVSTDDVLQSVTDLDATSVILSVNN